MAADWRLAFELLLPKALNVAELLGTAPKAVKLALGELMAGLACILASVNIGFVGTCRNICCCCCCCICGSCRAQRSSFLGAVLAGCGIGS